jgi:hypothetical protein
VPATDPGGSSSEGPGDSVKRDSANGTTTTPVQKWVPPLLEWEKELLYPNQYHITNCLGD